MCWHPIKFISGFYSVWIFFYFFFVASIQLPSAAYLWMDNSKITIRICMHSHWCKESEHFGSKKITIDFLFDQLYWIGTRKRPEITKKQGRDWNKFGKNGNDRFRAKILTKIEEKPTRRKYKFGSRVSLARVCVSYAKARGWFPRQFCLAPGE